MADRQATKLFYDMVWPHRTALLRVAHILTCNATEAEDLAQETMIKAFRAIRSWQGSGDMKAWLMTILRNTRIDSLRAARSAAETVSVDQIGFDPPDERAEAREWENPQGILDAFSDQQMIDALQRLPEEIRWTLLLADVEQWEHKDAAALLDVPVGTIKSRVHRGRAMLRASLLPIARALRLADQRNYTTASQTSHPAADGGA